MVQLIGYYGTIMTFYEPTSLGSEREQQPKITINN